MYVRVRPAADVEHDAEDDEADDGDDALMMHEGELGRLGLCRSP